MIRISFSISTNTKPFGMSSREQVRQPGRQEEEEADREQEREGDRAEPGAAADVLLLARPRRAASGRWPRCRARGSRS